MTATETEEVLAPALRAAPLRRRPHLVQALAAVFGVSFGGQGPSEATRAERRERRKLERESRKGAFVARANEKRQRKAAKRLASAKAK
jgi:hypothetical protein